jgi:hypothetical protein
VAGTFTLEEVEGLRRQAGATPVVANGVRRVLDEHRQLVAQWVELERLLDRLGAGVGRGARGVERARCASRQDRYW